LEVNKMTGFKRKRLGFKRGAVIPAVVAWVGMLGASVGLMQAMCIPPVVSPTPTVAPTPAPTPGPMTVNAGADQTATGGDTINLTAITTNGTAPFTFAWLLTSSGSAGSVILTNAATQTATATFSADAAGTFTFQVNATDSLAATASDTMDIVVTPSGPTALITFTLFVDLLTGTTGNDTFSAPIELVAGVQTPTIGAGDMADGNGGTDTLDVFWPAGANLNGVTLTNIGTLNFNNFVAGGLTVDATSFTGVTTINSVASLGDVEVNNVASMIAVGMTNCNQHLTVDTAAAATSGGTDTLNITLSGVGTQGVNTPEIIIDSVGTNGYESCSINSTGAMDNFLESLDMVNNTSCTTLTVTGDRGLRINQPLGDTQQTFTTVNASGMTVTSLGLDCTLPNLAVTFTGSPGDDVCIFSDTEYTTADSVDGGTGSADVISLGWSDIDNAGANALAALVTNISNFDILRISAPAATLIDSSFIGSMNSFQLVNGSFFGTLLVPSGSSVDFGNVYNNLGQNASAGPLTLDLPAAGGTCTVNLNDFNHGFGLTTTDILTLNVGSNNNVDGSAAAGNALGGPVTMTPAAGNQTLNISGAAPLALTGPTTADTIDASGLTGTAALTMTAGNQTVAAAGVSITGGPGADTLVGSANQDLIDGGAGNDTLIGDDSADTLTGGAGVDNFVCQYADAGEEDTADATIGAGGDVFQFDISALETAGTLGVAAVATDFVTFQDGASIAAGGGVVQELSGAAAVAANATVLVLINSTFANVAAVQTALETGGSRALTISAVTDQWDSFIVVYSDGTNTYVANAHQDTETASDTDIEAGDLTVLNLFTISGKTSIATGDFVSANFAFIP
jgi:hypothetical protein